MSITVMADVWTYSKQRGSHLLVLLAMADFANDGGVCWPSVKTLATKARISVRQTQYAIQSLASAGEIKIEPRARDNGSTTTNFYRVQVDRSFGPVVAPEDDEDVHIRAGAKSAPPVVSPVAPPPVRPVAPPEPSYRTIRGKGSVPSPSDPLPPDGKCNAVVVTFASLSPDAKTALDHWRQQQGKARPPKLNPALAARIEDAVVELGLERLAESAVWAAERQISEPIKWIRAAQTKRQQEDIRANDARAKGALDAEDRRAPGPGVSAGVPRRSGQPTQARRDLAAQFGGDLSAAEYLARRAQGSPVGARGRS